MAYHGHHAAPRWRSRIAAGWRKLLDRVRRHRNGAGRGPERGAPLGYPGRHAGRQRPAQRARAAVSMPVERGAGRHTKRAVATRRKSRHGSGVRARRGDRAARDASALLTARLLRTAR